MKFLHELDDAEVLFRSIADEKRIFPYLVEKDYWIMHALWGLQQNGFEFELKGGTSLSKGFKIIDRFSEDKENVELLSKALETELFEQALERAEKLRGKELEPDPMLRYLSTEEGKELFRKALEKAQSKE
jgi:predicted nucleotidyltransferase component of viral defense system